MILEKVRTTQHSGNKIALTIVQNVSRYKWNKCCAWTVKCEQILAFTNDMETYPECELKGDCDMF